MAQLTISEAARVAGVSRVTLHRYIKAGKLSRTADGLLDTAELLRVGLMLQADTLQQPVNVQRPATPADTPSVSSPVSSPDAAMLHQLVSVLQHELDAAHAREQAARDRETLLLQMLQQLQHQNQRLLDMPRPAPPAPSPRAPAAQPPRRAVSGDPRGAMRQRILALLAGSPEGLTPAEIRTQLQVERSLADTCLGMRRDGLLERVGRGRYVAAGELDRRRMAWSPPVHAANIR
jgi:hypothetical protein